MLPFSACGSGTLVSNPSTSSPNRKKKDRWTTVPQTTFVVVAAAAAVYIINYTPHRQFALELKLLPLLSLLPPPPLLFGLQGGAEGGRELRVVLRHGRAPPIPGVRLYSDIYIGPLHAYARLYRAL